MKISFKKYNEIAAMIKRFTTQQGSGLLEVVIAIGLISILSVTFMGSLGQVAGTVSLTDEQQIAKTIAEHQMEYVTNLSFSSSYTPASISITYPDYSVTISVASVPSRDSNIQQINILVSHQGKPIYLGQSAYTLQGYKVNR
jgi:type II secretory pathway pseudopilin PulG